MKTLTLKQLISLKEEEEIGTSGWLTITQERINDFAKATDDHQWIHVDPERCQKELKTTTIAHGFLSLSLLPYLKAQSFHLEGVNHMINYGLDKLRFTNTVEVDSQVRVKTLFLSAEPRGRSEIIQLKIRCILEVKDKARPAMVTDWIFLAFPKSEGLPSEKTTS